LTPFDADTFSDLPYHVSRLITVPSPLPHRAVTSASARHKPFVYCHTLCLS